MNRRPHMRRLLFFVGLLGCHGKSKEAPPPLPSVQVHDASGAVLAELRPIRPCRGSIGPIELIVGGPPLIAQIGTTRWAGESAGSATAISRDDEKIARIANQPMSVAVLDLQGVPVVRVTVDGAHATVLDAANTPLRTLTATPSQIDIEQVEAGSDKAVHAGTVTGTRDLVIAAMLASPEVVPEVRILAACERVLAPGKDTGAK